MPCSTPSIATGSPPPAWTCCPRSRRTRNCPLIGLGDKVLLSPHMIAYTKGGGLGPAIPWATDAILKALRGELPNHVFNEEVIPRWLERFGRQEPFGLAACQRLLRRAGFGPCRRARLRVPVAGFQHVPKFVAASHKP